MGLGSISLSDVLSGANVDGEVYLSDCHLLIGLDKDISIAKELQEILTQVKNKI